MPANSQSTYSPGNERVTSIGSFNQPDITDDGKIRNRPISNALQAYNIFQRFERENLHRAVRNAQVARAYSGEHPFDQAKLNAAGQGWRSNWSTMPFPNTVDRVKPRFTKAVADQKYLTNSVLPNTFPDASEKSDTFQEAVTKCIRQWSGWMDFVDRLASENLIYGYTGAVHLSQYDWRARTFRQEEILFDDNAPMHSERLECFVVKVDYFIHELLELIDNEEYAEDLGYNVPNIINAIRFAMPPRDSLVYNPRQLADMVRDGTMYYSRQKEARMIQTAHVFVMNYEGKIDHWWINRSTLGRGKQDSGSDNVDKDTKDDKDDKDTSTHESRNHEGIELLFCEAYAKSMEDIITLFSFEPGNGILHGSKGMGRKLYNVSLALDKLRNTMLDNIYLSSLIMGTMDSAKIAAMQPVVRSPFLQMPDGFVMAEQPQIQVNMQAFEYAGNQLQALLDQVAGTFMPDQYSATTGNHITDTTATEASLDAAREDEIKQGVLNRWWSQMQQCVQAMQRRLCSKENIQAAIEFKEAKDEAIEDGKTLASEDVIEVVAALDPDAADSFEAEPDLMNADMEAVKMLVELMENGLTPEEIYVIARQPSTDFTANVGAAEDQRIIQFSQAVEANPTFAAYFDQEKLARMAANAAIGASKTDELFQPMPQQTTDVAADRQQKIEFASMVGGEMMPVDPRDPHQVHLNTLNGKMQAWFTTMGSMPPLSIPTTQLTAAKLMIEHEGDHIQQMLEQGSTQQSMKQEMATYKLHEKALVDIGNKVGAAHQQQAQLEAQHRQQQAQMQAGGPNPSLSVPPGMFPPGQKGPVPQQIIGNGASQPGTVQGGGPPMQPQGPQGASGGIPAGGPPPHLPPPQGLPMNGVRQHPTAGQPDEELPKPSSPKEAAAFQPGTHFMDPKGKRRIRP
jgi:hypothetical protein